jgi:hypothetical protein
MGKFDSVKYEKAKGLADKFFKKNPRIISSALGAVRFNSDGFLHLIWRVTDSKDKKKHKRDWKNQIKRFQLLSYVKPVLQGMSHYQEYLESMETVKVKESGKTLFKTKKVVYYCFIAVIDDKIRIKVVLKKVGNGQLIFWSIIPYWKTDYYKDIKFVSLYKGDPATD